MARRKARRVAVRQQEAWFAALKPVAQQRLMLESEALRAGQASAADCEAVGASGISGHGTAACVAKDAAKLAALREAEEAVHADAAALWVRDGAVYCESCCLCCASSGTLT